jgi:transcriptional regulator with GAF, ATPase, and Fis domain/tetratricopeptide (TPR) repeat protein
MKNNRNDFSESQWRFLAVLEAIGAPAPINMACNLAPISPSELIDLIETAMDMGWLHKREPDSFALAPKLPSTVRRRIGRINRAGFISSLLERMEDRDFSPKASPSIRANLLARSGRLQEASFLEHEIGLQALRGGDPELSLAFFDRAVDKLSLFLGKPECDSLFVSAALELSHLRFRSGKRVGEVMGLLKKAKEAASRLGDRRSLTLIKLHMGRHVIMEDKPEGALELLASGLNEVNELGDKDILARAEEFSGLYHYIHGRFREAFENFEMSLQRAELNSERSRDFLFPQWLGFSSAYLGRVSYAVGLLKSHWRRAWQESEWGFADNFRATLGIVLLVTGNRREARVHLQEAFQSAVANQNHIGQFHSQLGLACCEFLESRFMDSYNTVMQAVRQASETGALLRQYTWPWFLEMLSEFERRGYAPVPGFGFKNEIERILRGPNAHLRGAALRLRAQESARKGADPALIWADLQASEQEQKASGSIIELSRTLFEMARHQLRMNEPAEAARLAWGGWERIAEFGEELFPEDLKFLLDPKKPGRSAPAVRSHEEELIHRFLNIMDEIVPGTDLDHFLHRVVTATARFFKSGRGGVFWFDENDRSTRPLLRAAHNLTREETSGQGFQQSMALIHKAHRKRSPEVRSAADRSPGKEDPGFAYLCIPFRVPGRASGVVYHDQPSPDQGFGSMDRSMLERVASHLGGYIERMWDYSRLLDEKALYTSNSGFLESEDKWKIRYSSLVMKQVLDRADRVANSEASVLITGETGVGKELLARRLHRMNGLRKGKPFVAVDITGIPKDLLESDLFGHEKGAFTGADRRKPGRLELAHGGTLFIDEVADIPLTMQVKLLRVLQEKSFYRVGGTQPITSDFRLVSATNRKIEEAVAGGAFREDLYYRLNVIQLVVPPLRNRGNDVVLLAREFLDHYAKKYQRSGLSLTTEDETLLSGYPWPGNVRELRNVMERAVLLSTGGRLELILPGRPAAPPVDPFSDMPTLDELQRRYIRHVLEKTNGHVGGAEGASGILGMKRTSLYTRMKALGLTYRRKTG